MNAMIAEAMRRMKRGERKNTGKKELLFMGDSEARGPSVQRLVRRIDFIEYRIPEPKLCAIHFRFGQLTSESPSYREVPLSAA